MKHEPPEDEKAKPAVKDSDVSLTRLLGLGLQLTVTVSVFTALGWWLQNKFGWTWGMQGMGALGIALGLFFFVKEATR